MTPCSLASGFQHFRGIIMLCFLGLSSGIWVPNFVGTYGLHIQGYDSVKSGIWVPTLWKNIRPLFSGWWHRVTWYLSTKFWMNIWPPYWRLWLREILCMGSNASEEYSANILTLKTEAICSSPKVTHTYQTTRYHSTEDHNMRKQLSYSILNQCCSFA
jgi:hypothetical protein